MSLHKAMIRNLASNYSMYRIVSGHRELGKDMIVYLLWLLATFLYLIRLSSPFRHIFTLPISLLLSVCLGFPIPPFSLCLFICHFLILSISFLSLVIFLKIYLLLIRSGHGNLTIIPQNHISATPSFFSLILVNLFNIHCHRAIRRSYFLF